jgi:hypothetical protein
VRAVVNRALTDGPKKRQTPVFFITRQAFHNE